MPLAYTASGPGAVSHHSKNFATASATAAVQVNAITSNLPYQTVQSSVSSVSDALLLALRQHPTARLFRALFQYIPMRDSPNENPQLELPLQAGDYILVHGEMDEDQFYHGQTLDGHTGLVPSNYVERVTDQQLLLNSSRAPSPSFPLNLPPHLTQIQHDFSLSKSSAAISPLPKFICPYPPIDVAKITVQEIKQTENPRGLLLRA